MGDTKLADYPARLGDKQQVVVDHTGPALYAAGGETIGASNSMTGITVQGLSAIDFVDIMDISVSGTYFVATQPTGKGPRKTAKLIWQYAGTAGQGVDGVVFTAGTGGTNGTATVNATGGGGSGASVSVVTAGGLITSVTLLNPGSGYTTVPTFTPAAGTGTITATIGSVTGIQVAAGTNLSGETVRLRYQGR